VVSSRSSVAISVIKFGICRLGSAGSRLRLPNTEPCRCVLFVPLSWCLSRSIWRTDEVCCSKSDRRRSLPVHAPRIFDHADILKAGDALIDNNCNTITLTPLSMQLVCIHPRACEDHWTGTLFTSGCCVFVPSSFERLGSEKQQSVIAR
jgi:hypothetical protein